MKRQVGPVRYHQDRQRPDVSAPERRGALALRGPAIMGKAVMDEDGRSAMAQALEVDEVAQRRFEVVHAVYKRQIDGHPPKFPANVGLAEKLVARLGEDPDVRRQG